MFLWKRRLFESRFVLWLLVLTVFVGEATITAGWWTAEVGRQPWVVYDVLKTADGVSPVLSAIDVVALARDVHRALRAAAGPVPVPAEPQDPGRPGGARGRRDGRRCRACRTRSATSSAAAAAPPTSETSHDPQRRLVRPVHPDHRRLSDPRRVRHGRRDPAPAAGADRRRAADVPQQHRPGLGRQRGLAGARRRRPVRRLPAGLRVAVLGPVPRVHAGPAGDDPADGRARVPVARSRASAGGPPGTRSSPPRRPGSRCCSASPSATSWPVCRSTRTATSRPG